MYSENFGLSGHPDTWQTPSSSNSSPQTSQARSVSCSGSPCCSVGLVVMAGLLVFVRLVSNAIAVLLSACRGAWVPRIVSMLFFAVTAHATHGLLTFARARPPARTTPRPCELGRNVLQT